MRGFLLFAGFAIALSLAIAAGLTLTIGLWLIEDGFVFGFAFFLSGLIAAGTSIHLFIKILIIPPQEPSLPSYPIRKIQSTEPALFDGDPHH